MLLGRRVMIQLNRLETLRDEILNEEIYSAEIEGVTVFVLPKKGFRRKYAEVFVKYGSNDVAFTPYGTSEQICVPPGIAHFLEHKMFEKQWGEAFSAFSDIGASANAYTSNNYTSYLFWTLENYPEALKLLMEVVFSPYFTDETVEKEKGIITQEIRMYQDQPGARLFREMLSSLFLKHPVRFDIAGTESSVQQITKEFLYLCHKNFYCGANANLYMAGDFNPDEALDLAAKLILESGPWLQKPPIRIRPDEPWEVGEDVRISMPVPTPLVQIGWKDNNLKNGSEMVLREIAITVLLHLIFGRSSSFFTRVHEEGLADRLDFSYEAWPDYGLAFVGAESAEPDRLNEVILNEIDRVKSTGVVPEDFERVKKAMLGRFITLFNSFDAVGQIQVHLFNVGENVFSYGSMLRNLDLDTVMAGIDCFQQSSCVSVVISNQTKSKA